MQAAGPLEGFQNEAHSTQVVYNVYRPLPGLGESVNHRAGNRERERYAKNKTLAD